MPRGLSEISRRDNVLAERIRQQGYFITNRDVPEIERINRLLPVLVRCNCCRFTCAIQDLKHLMNIIEVYDEAQQAKGLPGEYVRDVSFIAD